MYFVKKLCKFKHYSLIKQILLLSAYRHFYLSFIGFLPSILLNRKPQTLLYDKKSLTLRKFINIFIFFML